MNDDDDILNDNTHTETNEFVDQGIDEGSLGDEDEVDKGLGGQGALGDGQGLHHRTPYADDQDD